MGSGHRRRLILRVGAWWAGIWLLWRMPAPAVTPAVAPAGAIDSSGTGTRSHLSVVIPARDEARTLPALLASLSAQVDPADETVVVDDHSTDRTAEVALGAGVAVVASAALPAGWTGKTWACHQGAAVATGGLLAFIDADVTLASDALRRLRAEHSAHGGMVSVQPFHLIERPYEALSAIANAVVLMGTGAFTGAPRRPGAVAFGPVLVMGREDYDLIGGHAHPEVRALVAEDIGMARQCRRLGRPVRVLAGRDVVSFRMYPGGPGQLVEGWTKGLAYGARHTPPPLAAVIGLWVTGACLAAADGARVVGSVARRRPVPAGAAVAYGAWAAQVAWMLRRVGRFGVATSAAFPVPLAAFVALSVRSALVRARGRGAPWRGRAAPAV